MKKLLIFIFPALLFLTNCNESKSRLLQASQPSYVPGLGEIMGYIQVRHTKLWFAGKAENWPLANYEFEELLEGLNDIEAYHPKHEKLPVPSAEMIGAMIKPQLDGLKKAIEEKSLTGFSGAFEMTTMSCNACHAASGVAFIRLTTPTQPPFSNQIYEK